MSAWMAARLSEVIELVGGGTPKTSVSDYWGGDIPWLSVKDFGGGRRYVTEAEKRITIVGVENSSTHILDAGDLIISARGTVGEVAQLATPMAFNQSCYGVKSVAGKSDSSFLYYLLLLVVENLKAMSHGSVFSTITRDTFQQIEVKLPPIDEQRAIAATLGALDDKIESNRRLVEIIPQLIRAMVVRSLPASPRWVPVAHLATFVNGGAYTKGASGVGRIVIRIAELNSGIGGSTVYNDIDVPDDKIARPGDILMSWSGSLGVYRWKLDEAIVNQHIFKVLPSDGYPAWLVHDRLDAVMPVFRGIAQDKATTMGHIQRGHLESTMIEVPMPDVVQRLDEIVAPLWKLLLLAEREVVDLTALRDALLPELLSGRIRVPEAEGAVI